jgi:hypothetical protein
MYRIGRNVWSFEGMRPPLMSVCVKSVEIPLPGSYTLCTVSKIGVAAEEGVVDG